MKPVHYRIVDTKASIGFSMSTSYKTRTYFGFYCVSRDKFIAYRLQKDNTEGL
jgi:hypothetical protein